MSEIQISILDAARQVLATADVDLSPLADAEDTPGGGRLNFACGRPHPGTLFPDTRESVEQSIATVSSIAQGSGGLPAFIRDSGVFTDTDDAARRYFDAKARHAETLVIDHLPVSDPDIGEMARADAIARIAERAGLTDVPGDRVVDLVAAALGAEAAGGTDTLRRRLSPAVLEAGRVLAASPDEDITLATLAFYAGEDIPPDRRAEIVGNRLRAAESCPALAGFMATMPAIASAIDNRQTLIDAVAAATGGSITRPIFSRLAHARSTGARDMVVAGAFRRFPPDQVPSDARQWEIACLIWNGCMTLAADLGMDVFDIWRHDRFAYARGDWSKIADGIVRKITDTRPSHDSGLAAEQIPIAAAAMRFERFTPDQNHYRRAVQMADRGLQALAEAGVATNEIDHRAMTAWALRNCAARFTPEIVDSAFGAINEACSMFGMRVVIPTILTETQLPGAPVTSPLMQAAAATAFGILAAENSIVALADLGGRFRARAPLLLRQLATQSEVVGNDVAAVAAPPVVRKRPVQPEIIVADRRFRDIFRFTGEQENWPGVTPIIEVAKNIVVAPLTASAQAKEEGRLGAAGLDRCGVNELDVCIGIIYEPRAVSSRGVMQLLSFRQITPSGYKRLAAAVVNLLIDEKDGKVRFDYPASGHFRGQRNASPPSAAVEAMDRYIEFLSRHQELVPEHLRAEVEENGAQVQARVAPRAPVRHLDITIKRLLGYDPCRSYKLEMAWNTWIENGMISKKWADLPLADRISHDVSRPFRMALRSTLSAIGIRDIDKAPGLEDHAQNPVATPPRRAVPARVDRLSGVFV